MRVIGGKAKGRRLTGVPRRCTRPILSRVRTALFDILRPDLPASRVLDLFAGTGAVGIEALSQGAAHCVFCDLSPAAIRTIQANLERSGLSAQAEVIKTDALNFLEKCSRAFDLIYIAPPQYQGLWLSALCAVDRRPTLLNEPGRVIVQIDPKEYQPVLLSALAEQRQKRYGRTLLVFYGKQAAAGTA